jgi:hypothetical protein
MRRFGLVVAAGFLMAGTSAFAQVDVGSSASNGWFGQDTSFFTPQPGVTAGTGTFGESQFNRTPNTVTFNSFVTTTPSLVTFESSNASTGPFVTTSSSSQVNLSFVNTTGKPIAPTIASTISAAGLGFYIANTNAVDPTTGLACAAASCPGTLAHTFGDFASTTGSSSLALAGATFSFDIVADDRTVYSLTGQVNLFVNADGAFITQTLDSIGAGLHSNSEVNLNDASHRLDGFTQAWETDSAFGYAWDATNIFPTFLDTLNPGDTGLLTYETDVSSFTHSFCLADGSCLQAYSGFGDPIGRGGVIDSSARSPLGGFSFGSLGAPIVQGINFTPSSFNVPTFGPDGVLTFQQAGVPEPATWMTMILGFGLLGTALRRRRVLAYN